MKKVLKGIVIAFLALLLIALIFGNSGSKSKTSSDSSESGSTTEAVETGTEEQQPEETEQVFESATAQAKYKGFQDIGGNAMLSIAVTNNTDSKCYFSAENTVLNDEFNIQMLGGAASQTIDPGKSGVAGYTFGYSVQTTIENFEDIHSISFDLVQMDADTFDIVGSTPVYIEL